LPQRLAFVDALKAIASQFIVLHHLAFYGPMSDGVWPYAPDLVDWFADHARIAVQAFLVIGGFLAARSLAPAGHLIDARIGVLIAKRYLRLVMPYAVVIVLAIVAAHIARGWMRHDSISAPPTVAQVIAHLALLQDVLGFESLSAGLWYVAIDFQLYVLLLLLLLVGRGVDAQVGMAVVAGCGIASLLHFNRDPTWDAWAVYFFGAYAAGAVAYWHTAGAVRVTLVAVFAGAMLVALAIDFRVRIAVALGVAVLLVFAARSGMLQHWPTSATVAYLGRIAYSVFLAHFPVCLVVNAAWVRFLPETPWMSAVGMLVAWTASVLTGAILYRLVERPAGAWVGRLGAGAAALRRA
jgi:peptidoglycan/LPS O-acetylase OafA/YrhL